MGADLDGILHPRRLWSRAEVLARPSAAPAVAGVYGWFFREVPGAVPVRDCLVLDGATLLYVGIAPHPRVKGSKATLRSRLQTHYKGSAEGSTLRLTLGCLLEEHRDILLQLSRPGGSLTFGRGEEILSRWMETNALVSWVTTPEPRDAEHALLHSLHLPLNLEGNSAHPFHATLSHIRSAAKRRARESFGPVAATLPHDRRHEQRPRGRSCPCASSA